MPSRIFVSALAGLASLCLSVGSVACGGAIEQPSEGTPPAPSSSLRSASGDATPFGVWDLVSLEREGEIDMKVHDVMQLDVRADGSVVARRCGKQYYETGSVSVRCGDEASYDCYYGTATREGDAWRIDLPDLPTSRASQERVVETVTPGEEIRIRHIHPRANAGLFTRAPDDTRYATSTSHTVGNCQALRSGG